MNSPTPVNLVICLGGECLDRFGPVLRHLVVGLVDHVARIRLVSPDRRAELLALGPTHAIIHPPLRWPLANRRVQQVVDEVGTPIPTVIHAISASSYAMAHALAEEFDADLVLQVTSLEDCAEVERFRQFHIGRYLCFTEPLSRVLHQQLKIPGDLIEVVRPGILAADRPACFARTDRAAAIVCTAPFVKGGGIERVIDAAKMIQSRGRRAMFFLLGQGPLESALRRRTREQNVVSSVTFAHPGGDPFEVVPSADIFLHPAASGAMYIDALQAMGAGLAVVTVPDPLADFLHPGETAVVCEGESVTDLADGIDDLLSDRPLGQRLAAHSIAYIKMEHSMSAMADRTAAVYRKLLLARSTFALRE